MESHTDIEQGAHQGVLRDIVLHHEKDLAGLEYPQDFPQRLLLSLSFELVEGMRASHGIEAASGERQSGCISLHQVDVLESCRLPAICCQHPPGKINPNH